MILLLQLQILTENIYTAKNHLRLLSLTYQLWQRKNRSEWKLSQSLY